MERNKRYSIKILSIQDPSEFTFKICDESIETIFVGGLCEAEKIQKEFHVGTSKVNNVWPKAASVMFKQLVQGATELDFIVKTCENGRNNGILFIEEGQNVARMLANQGVISFVQYVSKRKNKGNEPKRVVFNDVPKNRALPQVEIEGDTDTEISFFTATYSQIHKSINAVGDINVKDLQGGVFVQARQVPELINTHENLIARAAQMLETVPNVLRLQSLAWPQIFSRRSIIIVANTEHVPKLVYLPAICTLVHKARSQKFDGPQVLIFCQNASQAIKIQEYCRFVISQQYAYFVYENRILTRLSENSKAISCSILITTADKLNLLCFDKFRNTPHVIFNDVHTFTPAQWDLAKAWYSEKLPQIQVIMTSNSYFPGLSYFHDNDLTSMLLMKSLTDVFCYLSGSVIRIIHSNPKRKKNHLNEKLKACSGKTIIMCDSQNDVQRVSELLTSDQKHHRVLDGSICDTDARKWQESIGLCSDECFPNFSLDGVNHIIHFSLPTNVDAFFKRYQIMARLNPLLNSDSIIEMNSALTGVSSTIICTMARKPQVVFIAELIVRLRYSNIELETIQEFRDLLLTRLQQMNGDVEICPVVTHYGELNHLIHCDKRHFLQPNIDMVTTKTETFKFEVLEVHSPVHYSIRLKEYLVKSSEEWHAYAESDRFEQFETDFNEYYSKNFVPIQNADVLTTGVVYVVKDHLKFYRCRVLAKTDIGSKTEIRLKKIDYDQELVCESTKIGEIKLTEHSTLCAQALSLVLLHRVPMSTGYWSTNDSTLVEEKLSSHAKNKEYWFELNSFVQINDIIFTDNIGLEMLGLREPLSLWMVNRRIATIDGVATLKFLNMIANVNISKEEAIKLSSFIDQLMNQLASDEETLKHTLKTPHRAAAK